MTSLISLMFVTIFISSCTTPTSKYFTYVPSSQSETAAQNNVDRYRYEDILPSLDNQNSISLDDPDVNKLGYFHNLRKAIELVWEYPPEASASGKEGAAMFQFTVLEDGKVKDILCTKSSGHFVLDESTAKAISQASPFAPIPKTFKKRNLIVTGTFKYVLASPNKVDSIEPFPETPEKNSKDY